MLINWLAASAYLATRHSWIVAGAIIIDLLLLGLFKYEGLLASVANAVPGLHVPALDLALPLGISFFTFHHIMYLVDLRGGKAPSVSLTKYALYISFFPQVLSGPLVRWSEILHQLDNAPFASGWQERFSRGVFLMLIGLGKKVLLADALAQMSTPVFDASAAGEAIAPLSAWHATLAFTLQIYFDFSGYTDMALGIALMFGIVLPQNFDAPYRAVSIQDFWRRWHMTLSRFLRDYLYIPLGGSRHGLPRRLLALLTTMTLGGLWHGAGLTYLAWGAAHGAALGAGVLWHRAELALAPPLGWLLTFLFLMLTWVLFRCHSFAAAAQMYRALAGAWPGDASSLQWPILVVAAAMALIGPTSWQLAYRLAPRRWLALVAAGIAVIELLKIGDDSNYEFIYFKF